MHISTASLATATPVASTIALTEKPQRRRPLPVTADGSKVDKRCHGWVKIIERGVKLPLPADVRNADHIRTVPYARQKEIELFQGDAMIWGEANHHKHNYGWSYRLEMNYRGKLIRIEPGAEIKAAIKAAIADGSCKASPKILAGSGEVAAMVRIVHAVRKGFNPSPFNS